jgi:hypothetical protein
MHSTVVLDILTAAQEIMHGPPVKIDARNWATWWCPFHDDAAKIGSRKQPNFGINLENGQWKCLRCWKAGGSLNSLRRELGIVDWRPVAVARTPPNYGGTPARPPSNVAVLDEAIAEARAALTHSPAWAYLAKRGIKPYTALVYGLGYGPPSPSVHRDTTIAARKAMLATDKGFWLWAGGVVYADPPTRPRAIQVRHLREGVDKKYQTWGSKAVLMGAWRLSSATRTAIIVEGLFDMLMFAQAIHERKLTGVTPLFTGGASPSHASLDWLSSRAGNFEYVLVPDPDEAGQEWTEGIQTAIRKGGGKARVSQTPGNLDPDEAILSGWWPEGI